MNYIKLRIAFTHTNRALVIRCLYLVFNIRPGEKYAIVILKMYEGTAASNADMKSNFSVLIEYRLG